MVQIPVWPLPYWATACLLCLAYVPMVWVTVKSAKKTFDLKEDLWGLYMILGMAAVIGMVIYACAPGFYFTLSLKDVQWAYLEAK